VTGDTSTEGRSRGRPRSQQAHRAVLAAAVELLLARGLSAVSMDTVAERAGVSKATIYRWWPTKEALALDALYTEWAAARPSPRDTGALRGDLLSLLRPWARLASSRPYGRVIAALLTEANTDPAFAAEYRQRVLEPRRDQARAIFHRAIERGEIPANTKIEVALDLLFGALYHRLLHGHAPLADRFVRDVIDTALNGIQPVDHATTPTGRPATTG
jgi:AcrR family transcriptional regulator